MVNGPHMSPPIRFGNDDGCYPRPLFLRQPVDGDPEIIPWRLQTLQEGLLVESKSGKAEAIDLTGQRMDLQTTRTLQGVKECLYLYIYCIHSLLEVTWGVQEPVGRSWCQVSMRTTSLV